MHEASHAGARRRFSNNVPKVTEIQGGLLPGNDEIDAWTATPDWQRERLHLDFALITLGREVTVDDGPSFSLTT